MNTCNHDVVIIGSGFGGSIAALRLAQAGRQVLVLERGRRYGPRSFPRDIRDPSSLLWRAGRSRGLFELRFFSGVGSLTAAGVGGGSLIYASIHYRPRREIFDDPRWPAPFTLERLRPYYDRVAAELGVAPLPAALRVPKRDAFHRAGAAMGRPVDDPPLAVSWSSVFGAQAGARSTCQLCAECEYGCPHGAKNTLDFTYLAKAEALGARVSTGCQVSHIAPADGGGWEVHAEDLDGGARLMFVGKTVVLAAGALGSTEILLRSRDEARTLPRLSSRLGQGYSGNGDFLGNIQGAAVPLEPWTGPDVTSVMWHDDFVLAAPTFGKPVMEVLASHGQPGGQPLGALARPLWRRLPRLLAGGLRAGIFAAPLPAPAPGAGPPEQMTTVFAIGRDNAGGRMLLRRGRMDLLWDYERENRDLVARQRAALQDLARQYGGRYADFPTWQPFRRPITVHNLGGCVLSERPEDGVVGVDGQVHGHRGLYVADGAVIPTSIGSHPVMTISAVAEWISAHIADSFA